VPQRRAAWCGDRVRSELAMRLALATGAPLDTPTADDYVESMATLSERLAATSDAVLGLNRVRDALVAFRLEVAVGA
jgi:hypothetical protein